MFEVNGGEFSSGARRMKTGGLSHLANSSWRIKIPHARMCVYCDVFMFWGDRTQKPPTGRGRVLPAAYSPPNWQRILVSAPLPNPTSKKPLALLILVACSSITSTLGRVCVYYCRQFSSSLFGLFSAAMGPFRPLYLSL